MSAAGNTAAASATITIARRLLIEELTAELRYQKPADGFAMNFREIGEAMGIAPMKAWTAYQSGMKKLRRNPAAMAGLLVLAGELERGRRTEHTLWNARAR